jgi:hypothetical protein
MTLKIARQLDAIHFTGAAPRPGRVEQKGGRLVSRGRCGLRQPAVRLRAWCELRTTRGPAVRGWGTERRWALSIEKWLEAIKNRAA